MLLSWKVHRRSILAHRCCWYSHHFCIELEWCYYALLEFLKLLEPSTLNHERRCYMLLEFLKFLEASTLDHHCFLSFLIQIYLHLEWCLFHNMVWSNCQWAQHLILIVSVLFYSRRSDYLFPWTQHSKIRSYITAQILLSTQHLLIPCLTAMLLTCF